MSGTLNTNIPLGFRPTPGLGLDVGGAMEDAQRILQIRQARQQVAKGNALQNIMGTPGALDAMGQPTPETMQKVMGVDVNAGLALKRASMVSQEQAVRGEMLKSDAFAKKMEIIGETYGPIVEAYDEAVKKGTPPSQAMADAQRSMSEANDRVRNGGLFTPDEQKKMPLQFDPMQLRNMVAGTKHYDNWRKSQQAERRLDETAARDQRNYERGGVGTGVDVDGRPYIIRPNAPVGEHFVYNDGQAVPDDKLVGSHKMGSTAPSAGDPKQVRAAVMKQIRSEPDWANRSEGEVGLEAYRRMKAAGTAPSGIADDPETLAYAAEYFKRTQQMPFGMGGKEDREAVLKYLAHEGQQSQAQPQPGAPAAGGQPPAQAAQQPAQPGQPGQAAPQSQSDKVADALVSGASYKADMNSLRRLQQQSDSISGYEKGATKEFDLAVSLLPKSPEPLNMQALTRWVRTGERQFNDVPNGQFYVALTSALDEYAKVISGATGSAAASTDSARNQALSLIPPGSSTDYVKGLVKTIKAGMDNRRSGYTEQISEIKARMRGTANGTPASPGSAPAAAAPVTGTGGPWKDQPIPDKAIQDLKKSPGTAAAFDEHFQSPGLAAKILGAKPSAAAPAPAPAATPAPAPSGAPPAQSETSDLQDDPTFRSLSPEYQAAIRAKLAAKDKGGSTKQTSPTEASAQPKSWALPAARANDPDGTTYNNGRYLKRGDRLIEVKPEKPADEGTSLSRAKAAIAQGADPEKVKKMLRDAGIDPAKLDRIQREEVGEGWPARFRTMIGMGDDSPQPKVTYGDRLAHYPAKDEVKAARDADFSYGTGNEAFMSGQRQRELPGGARSGERLEAVANPKEGRGTEGTADTGDLYTRAQLAVLRSPISALGYEPRKINLDTKAGGKMNIAGAYDPDTDSTYSNAAFESNMVHEATHRGLEKLRKAGVVPKELWDRLPKEEDIVRYIMALHMGDPEKGRGDAGDEQRATALYRFGRDMKDPQKYDSGGGPNAKKYRSALNELTGIAATYFGSLHPGGPR